MNTEQKCENIVSLQHVSRKFGSNVALCDVSLEIPKGCVFGLVGVNGAGKTTLIRHILGLYRAHQGSVTVFGSDPAVNPERSLAHVGYLCEEDFLPSWMRVEQIANFYKPFYPNWDSDYESELIDMFSLDRKAKLRHLSKGQRARVALVVALAHRPDLLVLDEPSSGLDPIVRGDILEAIIRTVADEGRTVLFSSHLLDEVQRVADRVAVLDSGNLIFDDSLDALTDRFRRLSLRFETPHETAPSPSKGYGWRGSEFEWSVVIDLQSDTPEVFAEEIAAGLMEVSMITLHELFVARLGHSQTHADIESEALV